MPARTVEKIIGISTEHLAASAMQSDWDMAPGEHAVRLGLKHLDVVLRLSIEPAGLGTGPRDFDFAGGLDADSSDPVVSCLVSALGAAAMNESDGGAHLDAIRLALIVRWLGRRIITAAPDDRPSVRPLQKWRMKLVERFIDQRLDKSICLADLAQVAGLSPMYFAAQFRAATGLRPHDFLLQRRIERSKELLTQPNHRLVEIALDVGFQTQAHFTTVFKRFVGTTPGRWRMSHLAAA